MCLEAGTALLLLPHARPRGPPAARPRLQQRQARKLPADSRVYKHEQSLKDRVSCSCPSCAGELVKLSSPALTEAVLEPGVLKN